MIKSPLRITLCALVAAATMAIGTLAISFISFKVFEPELKISLKEKIS